MTQCRAKQICNLRQEGSTKAAIAAVIQPGAIVHIQEVQNGWARVQVINGWISAELLEVIE